MDHRRKTILFFGIIASLLLIIIASFIAANRTSWRGRAQTPGGSLLSLDNSYVFASPISAEADGVSQIRVTVFLLNTQGLGVAGQTVELKISGPVTIAKVQPISDSFGRSIFDATSSTPGDYTISASVSSAVLPQSVAISFQ